MRAAIYCRLSEEDRNKQFETNDSNSIQNQKAMLLQYALNHRWEVFNIYSDDDYTGSDRNRPEFNKLLRDAEARRFDIILCKTQSRFTRELELVEKYIHGLFPVWGIRFIGVVDNADTDNRGNKKSRQINGLVNEWYLEDMSENIRSVLINRRQNGFHIGAFAPYGYQKDPEQKGHLIIDEEAAVIVREVFTLFSQGYGKTAIARMLNDRGVPNPTEYKRRHGLRYRQPRTKSSTLWKYFTVADMLINEVYIGNMVQGKYGSVSYKVRKSKPRPKDEWYRVEGTHEPLIERELWDHVQALIAQRAKPFDVGQIGLFARKTRCAYCGYTLSSFKNGTRRYLQCPNRHMSKDTCTGAFISVDRLKEMVINELNRLSAEYVNIGELEQNVRFCSTLDRQKKRLNEDLSAYEAKIRDSTRTIRELYLDKVRGIISEQDYLEMSLAFSQEKERLSVLLPTLERELTELDERIAAGDDCKALIEKYTNLTDLTREMVEILIDYISVGRRIPGTKDTPIEIHWNF